MLLTVLVLAVVLRSTVTIAAKTIQDYWLFNASNHPLHHDKAFCVFYGSIAPTQLPSLSTYSTTGRTTCKIQKKKKNPTLWHVIEFVGKSLFLCFTFEKYEKQVKLNHFPKFLHEF